MVFKFRKRKSKQNYIWVQNLKYLIWKLTLYVLPSHTYVKWNYLHFIMNFVLNPKVKGTRTSSQQLQSSVIHAPYQLRMNWMTIWVSKILDMRVRYVRTLRQNRAWYSIWELLFNERSTFCFKFTSQQTTHC